MSIRRYIEIVEALDPHDVVETGLEAYRKLLDWLERVGAKEMFDDVPMPPEAFEAHWAPGAICVRASDVGIADDELIIVLIKERGGTGPMFAFTPENQPVMVLPTLKAKRTLTGAYGNMWERWNRAAFVHEFTHFRQWRLTGEREGRGTDKLGTGAAYYNSAHEIEAFTTEAMGALLHDARARARWPDDAAEWAKMDDNAWFALVRKTVLDEDFYRHLTPANRAKVRRAMMKFVKDRILPILMMEKDQ